MTSTPSSSKRLSTSSKASTSSSSAASLHYASSLPTLQSLIRTSYTSHHEATTAWSLCSTELVQRAQSLINRHLQLIDSREGEWGELGAAAVQAALWREERRRMRRDLQQVDDVLNDLTACYHSMHHTTTQLRTSTHAFINQRLTTLPSTLPSLSSTLSTPLFPGGTLPLPAFLELLAPLTSMFSAELALKTAVVAHLASLIDSPTSPPNIRATLDIHLSVLILEPFLVQSRLDHVKRLWETEVPQVAE